MLTVARLKVVLLFSWWSSAFLVFIVTVQHRICVSNHEDHPLLDLQKAWRIAHPPLRHRARKFRTREFFERVLVSSACVFTYLNMITFAQV